MLDYPRDWQIVAGAGDVVVAFTERRSEATFVIERLKMNTALEPRDVTDLFGQLEAETLRARQPGASGVVARILDEKGRRVVTIDYSRPAVARYEPERVRQVSVPVGATLYRLTCSALTARFARYEPIFARLLDSFQPVSFVVTPPASSR